MNTADLKKQREQLARLTYNTNGGVNVGFTLPPQRQCNDDTQIVGASVALSLMCDGLRHRAWHAMAQQKGGHDPAIAPDVDRQIDEFLAAL